MNDQLVTVARWSSSPITSTVDGSRSISSLGLPQGTVDRRLTGLHPAPGKAHLALSAQAPRPP